MEKIDKCLECGTKFIEDKESEDWTWFTCEICGADYSRDKNNKWRIHC